MEEVYKSLIIRTDSVVGASFEKRTIIDNQMIVNTKCNIWPVSVNIDNKIYLLLYNSKREIIREAYQFLNDELEKQSINSRLKALHALKLFFAFAEIMDIDYKKPFDTPNFNKFCTFIKQHEIDCEIKKYRTIENTTYNGIISVCRSFLSSIGIKISPFHEKIRGSKHKSGQGFSGNRRSLHENKYKVSRINSTSLISPIYITMEEFNKIIKIVRAKYSVREEIIISLMYTAGSRIGETLGITLEDLSTLVSGIDFRGRSLGVIILRNRLSDRADQLAKTYMIPTNECDYESRAYNSETKGFGKIYPDMKLLKLIEQYVEEIHGSLSKVNRTNYLKKAKADKVTDGDMLETDDNYYIFLNKNGTPLTQNGWNVILRKIFIEAGIPIDKGSRQHNLSHKLRHGFAMYLRKEYQYDSLDLMYALRHKSERSVAVYFNPEFAYSCKLTAIATENMIYNIHNLKNLGIFNDENSKKQTNN